jgi:DNA-binding NtrC family response regulator
MNIALLASDPDRLREVAFALSQEGIEAAAYPLEGRAKSRLGDGFDKGVLVVPQHGAGAQIEKARAIFCDRSRLILCSPQPSNADRQLLLELGAAEIITPRSWNPAHVAERILAHLILEGDVRPYSFGEIRGATGVMRNLYRDIETIAPLSDTVLILGETGTGKELIAREVHRASGRAGGFIAINCAELSVELTGSDLFGHKKGAFTGATAARHGLLAEAGPGTVFLDEIGEFDLLAQAKLLRVLEDKTVRRVGSNTWETIKARFILATNRNLEGECENGSFRTDLLYRINELTLESAPLRERMADIPLLVKHFVSEFNREHGKDLQIPPNTLDSLFNYLWPGNVRELRGVVRKAAAYADQAGHISAIRLQDTSARRRHHQTMPRNSIDFDPGSDKWRDVLHRTQSAYFRAVLAAANGNKEEAAKRAGMSRSQFYEKLKEVGSK